MPKLKDVKTTSNSMSWDEVNCRVYDDKVLTTIPRREFLSFIEKGKKVKKITLEFAD